MSNTKLYIGADPDLRLLNIAVLRDKTVEAIFLRRNKVGTGDTAVAAAAVGVAGVFDDFITWITVREDLQSLPVVLIVESQNMEHARHAREKEGRRVNYQDILTTGQMAGLWLGRFADIADTVVLVQPMTWKQQVPKNIHHQRIYRKVQWNTPDIMEVQYDTTPLCPNPYTWLVKHSSVQPNPGDFLDINDSIGLALYGAESGL